MPLSNAKKAEISYIHGQEIQRVFKSHIHGELFINHFSINIFYAEKSSIFFSPTPRMAEDLCKKNFVNYDSNYDRKIITKYEKYSWRSVARSEMDNVINHVKEEKFGMRNGLMIIRDLGHDRHLMYSVATHKKEKYKGQLSFLYHCKANCIAEMGDFMYNELLPIINEYTMPEGVSMPRIDYFRPINIEQGLGNDFQKDLFLTLNENQDRFVVEAKKHSVTKHGLMLLNGGKIHI